MTMLADQVDVVVGVDTHKHTHTGAIVLAGTGAAVADLTVCSRPSGYEELLALAEAHGGRRAWAIESTRSYGAGLTRFLESNGERVVELDRPQRMKRRNGEKSDPQDAIRAAREALSREHQATPRATGIRAALSVHLAARRSAVLSATVACQQLQALALAAPEPLRAKFSDRTTPSMLDTAARLRLDERMDPETAATVVSLRALARRHRALTDEADDHKAALAELVRAWRPELLEVQGVGPIVAATVLCAWSHKGRVRDEGAFARLAGVAPILASSGMTNRHRRNPHGDRQLNRVLHTVVVVRARQDPATRDYIARRTKEGKSAKEIKRCLTRYVARELFKLLEAAEPAPST